METRTNSKFGVEVLNQRFFAIADGQFAGLSYTMDSTFRYIGRPIESREHGIEWIPMAMTRDREGFANAVISPLWIPSDAVLKARAEMVERFDLTGSAEAPADAWSALS